MSSVEPWRLLVETYKLMASGRSYAAGNLSITVVSSGHHSVSASVRVTLPESRRELIMSKCSRTLDLRDGLQTGDAAFDAFVYLRDGTNLYGRLSAANRSMIVSLVEAGAEAHGGALVLEPWATEVLADPVAVVTKLVALAAALDGGSAQDIARILQEDPNANVRARYNELFARTSAVQVVLREQAIAAVHQATGASFETLRTAMSDRVVSASVRTKAVERLLALFAFDRVMPLLERGDPEVVNPNVVGLVQAIRSEANAMAALPILMRVASHFNADVIRYVQLATELGATRYPCVLPVLALLVDNNGSTVARNALLAMIRLPVDATEIDQALSDNGRRLALTLVPELCERDATLNRSVLLPLYARLGEREVQAKTRFLRLFASSGDQRFLPMALVELEDTEHLDIRLAAISVCASLGNRTCLPKLRPLTEGLLRDAETKNAAREAVAAIKARHPAEGEPGSLSVASSGGEVSVLQEPRPLPK